LHSELQNKTGEGEVHAELALEPGQEVRPAHVGEETDACFGHRKQRALRGNTVAPRYRHADTAAHGDAINQRHIRLLQARQSVVRLFVCLFVGGGKNHQFFLKNQFTVNKV
jgi:hypothetical protein